MKLENISVRERDTMWVVTFFFPKGFQYHLVIEKEASPFILIRELSRTIQQLAILGETNG